MDHLVERGHTFGQPLPDGILTEGLWQLAFSVVAPTWISWNRLNGWIDDAVERPLG